jgi:hypothetical protein
MKHIETDESFCNWFCTHPNISNFAWFAKLEKEPWKTRIHDFLHAQIPFCQNSQFSHVGLLVLFTPHNFFSPRIISFHHGTPGGDKSDFSHSKRRVEKEAFLPAEVKNIFLSTKVWFAERHTCFSGGESARRPLPTFSRTVFGINRGDRRPPTVFVFSRHFREPPN